jgi:hypothetical protein
LDEAVRVLELEPNHFLVDLSHIPRFGDVERDLTWVGYRHVLVEVGEEEATANWRPGFFRCPLPPAEVYFRIHVHRLLAEHWRDEWKRGRDADGDPALWLWAVLRIDAPESAWSWDNREQIRSEVRVLADESGLTEWVYVRFRNEKEERAAS